MDLVPDLVAFTVQWERRACPDLHTEPKLSGQHVRHELLQQGITVLLGTPASQQDGLVP